MDYPRETTSPMSAGAIAVIVVLGFAALMLAATTITSVLKEAPAEQSAPAATPQPAPAPATPPSADQQPATGPAAVKPAEVPTGSQQPADTSNPQTAPKEPPSSKPGNPSPNVPAPAPKP